LRFRLRRGNLRAQCAGKARWTGIDVANQIGVPGMMQAGGASVDDDLLGVAAGVRTARGGVQGLMKITDEMNDEGKCLQALCVGLRLVGQHSAPAVDFRKHAVVSRKR